MAKREIHRWTAQEDAFLRQNYLHMTNMEMYRALDLPDSPAPKQAVQSRLRRLGLKRPEHVRAAMMASTQFQSGHVPFNRGKYMRVSQRTEFKKGHLPHNTKHDGAISVRTDTSGRKYKYIRLAQGKWRELHRHLWEQERGPIPKGMIIVFKSGDSLDCRLGNLEMISKAENVRRNQNHKKAAKSLAQYWQTAQGHCNSDKYISSLLAQRDRALRAEFLKKPQIVELKRLQFQLQRKVKNAEQS